jgi:hypothetical protein
LGAGKMRTVPSRRLHEVANLLDSRLRQPPLTAPALDRGTICFDLIQSDGLMSAFVTENPEFYGGGKPAEEPRIEDDKTCGGRSKVIQIGIEHSRKLSANHSVAIDF